MSEETSYLDKCVGVVVQGMKLSRPVTEEDFRQICGTTGVDPESVILLAITGKMGDFIPDYIRADVLQYFMPDEDSELVDNLFFPEDKE